MADGNRQGGFGFRRVAATSQLRPGEIVVDLFAGGGGASEALEQALGRPVDIAINHDEWAVGMHAANHPFTEHLREDVWHADPVRQVNGRAVGWFHASPDCTHFSQARGGQPRSRATRSLSWVVLKWAGSLAKVGHAPRIISLENVEQILKWGPLIAKRCKDTGRVIKLDGTVAEPGEQVSVWNQSLVPDKSREGQTWRQFVAALRGIGYVVEWRKLVASDYGAGTSRKRLFLVARRDVAKIEWPEPTHGKKAGLLPLVTAADCIDFSVPCPSIFERRKPLAPATLRRIAKGVKRYVIDAAEPFIVGVGGRQGQSPERSVRDPLQTVTAKADSCIAVPTLVPFVTEHANASAARNFAADEPMRTQCAQVKGGHFAAVAPVLVQAAHGEGTPDGVKRWGDGTRAADEPIGTITASGGHAFAAATLIQTGYGERPGQSPRVPGIDKPLGTLVDGQKHAVVAASLIRQFGTSVGSAADEPVGAIVAGGNGKTSLLAAHLTKFNTGAVGSSCDEPLHTITAGGDAKRPAGGAHALGLSVAYLEQANGGFYEGAGTDLREPAPTICAQGSYQRLVTAHLTAMAQNVPGVDPSEPLPTILAGATRYGVVECILSPEHEAGALRVAAFLINYYGNGQALDLDEPIDTITTRDRLALVTVYLQGVPYVIVDIGLRMLRREELFRAQGFPASYIIDRTADGRPLSISRSVRMVGNSVSPPPLRAIALANLDRVPEPARAAA